MAKSFGLTAPFGWRRSNRQAQCSRSDARRANSYAKSCFRKIQPCPRVSGYREPRYLGQICNGSRSAVGTAFACIDHFVKLYRDVSAVIPDAASFMTTFDRAAVLRSAQKLLRVGKL